MPPKRRESAASSKREDRPRNYVPNNAFSRLIHRRKEELGLTWYEIADRGGFNSHTIVYAIAKKEEHKQPPRQDTLKRIALALNLPLDVVKSAAAEACGYQLQEINVSLRVAETAKIIISGLEEIDDEALDKLRAQHIAFLAEYQEMKRQADAGG